MRITKLCPEDFDRLKCQKKMAYINADMPAELKQAFAMQEHSYTFWDSEGKALSCFGIVDLQGGRGEMWSVMHESCGSAFVGVCRAGKALLDAAPFQRVEAVVDCDFEESHRLVKLLGFELETPVMRSYRENGKDCSMYVRIKQWQ